MPVKAKPKPKVKVETLSPADIKKAIDKHFGEGTMLFGNDPSLKITRIPCDILSIDYLLGGGFARNRSYELYGQYSVGKSALALYLAAACQKAGGQAAYIDCEKSFDPVFAKSLGVKIKTLAYHRQKTGQQCVDFIEALLYSGSYDVIILDSIASLLPKAERDESMEKGNFGTYQAKLMSQALRKLTTANSGTVLIFINQLRENVGSMFGNKYITSGGKAMGFYAGTRLELVRTETIKKKAKEVNPKTGELADVNIPKGHRVLVTVAKDKTGGAKQGDKTTFVFDYDLGCIDPIEDLMYVGRITGVIHKAGTKWWIDDYKEEAQESRGKFKSWLRRQPAMQEEVFERIQNAPRGDESVDQD